MPIVPFLLLIFLFWPPFRHITSFGADQHPLVQEAPEETNQCEFSLQKIPGLSPLVKTDRNGRSCRGEVKLPFCRGLCRSKETGTHVFPHREREAYFCGIVTDNVPMKNVTLDECEEGAEEEARFVQISSATECKCIRMA